MGPAPCSSGRSGRGPAQPVDRGGVAGPVRAVAYPAAGTLAVAGGDGAVRLWDTATRSPRGAPMRAAKTVLAVAPSSDARTLALAGVDGLLQDWDAGTRRPLGAPLPGPTGAVKAVARNGELLAASGDAASCACGAGAGRPGRWTPAAR